MNGGWRGELRDRIVRIPQHSREQAHTHFVGKTKMTISQVDFGRVDAERDTNLVDYFVDTGVFDKIRNGKKQYVIGRKGSGKTAIFRVASKERLGVPVIPLDFAEYSWPGHKAIKEDGVPQESAYIGSWRFTFLIATLRHWSNTAGPELAKESRDLLKKIYREEEPGFLESLIDKFRRVRKIEGPSLEGVGGLGGFELEDKAGPVLAQTISQWSRVLMDFVAKHFPLNPFTMVLDRLDDGWDASDDSKMLLAGAIKASRDFNAKLQLKQRPAPVIVFLRSDIYDELQFNDKNKIFTDIEFLNWTDDKLEDVVVARICRSLTCARDEAWSKVFSKAEMRQRASIKSYIMKRTMGRPRDIIAFCINCQEVATAAGHSIVETDDVYAAEEAYSKHIYDELDDEMHKQIEGARSLLQILRDIGFNRFVLSDWLNAGRKREQGASDDKLKSQLQVLFDYSIVGVQRRGGISRGTSFQFRYNDRLLEPNFTGEMIVHPSMKKHLKLKEPRRDSIPEGEADD
ncbi:MAG: hypothetical protein HYS70_00175 [Nitrospinae bacterium]|nr:hypothetical protein [Nitrospinota bacterium]